MHTVMIQSYEILREYAPLSASANSCLSALIWLRDKLGLKPILFSRRPKGQVTVADQSHSAEQGPSAPTGNMPLPE